MAVEIVSFPMNSMVIFHRCVSVYQRVRGFAWWDGWPWHTLLRSKLDHESPAVTSPTHRVLHGVTIGYALALFLLEVQNCGFPSTPSHPF